MDITEGIWAKLMRHRPYCRDMNLTDGMWSY